MDEYVLLIELLHLISKLMRLYQTGTMFYFLYVLLQISKNYLAEDVNMALKGILSKSKLEEKQLIVPPIELQNQFADFVRQVDKSKLMFQKLHQKLNILQQKAGDI